MPAPGDQHRATTVTANPFEEPEHKITTYTAEQVATLQSRLNKFLGPEYISSRDGPGGKKLHYIAAAQCIQLANEVFGFNGWSSSIREVQVDFVEETSPGKFSMAVSVVMRVTLRDGTFHEDIGYGQIENCKSKATGFEKTKKEATTDALKRALRNFGNVLGNCIYDKDYVSKVTKIKVKPRKYEQSEWHRHSDYVPVRSEPTFAPAAPISDPEPLARPCEPVPAKIAIEDDFDSADFDDVDFSAADDGHPDGMIVDEPVISNHFSGAHGVANGSANGRAAPLQRSASNNNNPMAVQAQQRAAAQAGPGPSNLAPQPYSAATNGRPRPPSNPPSRNQSPARPRQETQLPPLPPMNGNPPINDFPVEQAPPIDPPATFFSARAAGGIPGKPPAADALFNPHADSPSIRKTAGIDHTKSMRLSKDLVPVDKAVAPAAGPRGFVAPGMDGVRQIGMPQNRASPMANRSSYKPPMKRPLDNGAAATTGPPRPPLSELPGAANVIPPAPTAPDPKRQRVDTETPKPHISQ